MKKAIINPGKCNNCPVCSVEEKCAKKAVFREDSDRPWIDFYKCSGCMKCRSYCFNGSIEEIS
jgi:MinD superfamily P-loop ATPase